MFLTEFRVGNFKAFRETQRLPIKPITLIFGPNSGGKSSLIHALLLAHEGITKENLDAHTTRIGGDNVDLGGFRQYVHRRDVNADVELGFRLTKPPLPDKTNDWANTEWNVSLRLAFDGKAFVREYLFDGDRERIRLSRESSDAPLALVQIDDHAPEQLYVFTQETTYDVYGEPDDEEPQNATAETSRRLVTDVSAKCRGLAPRQLLHGKEGAELKVREPDDDDGRLTATLNLADKELPGYMTWDQWKEQHGITEGEHEVEVCPGLDGSSITSIGGRTPSGKEYDEYVKRLRESTEHWVHAIPFRWLNDMVKAVHARLEEGFGSPDASRRAEFGHEMQKNSADGFGGLRYLGPFRSYPPRRLLLHGEHDPNYFASGASAWDVVRTNPEVREAVNRWLGSELLQTPFRLEARQYYDMESLSRVLSAQSLDREEVRLALERTIEKGPGASELLLTDTRTGTLVSHRDIGVGISQVLPVLVEAYGSRGATIVIEQPEIHLHPALQAKLGDVFIKAATSERENTFIIETHSEHLVLRLLRRIRETTEGTLPGGEARLEPKDVSIVYVEPTESGSLVREMEFSGDGRLVTPWPGGFFEEGFRERFGDDETAPV